LQARNLGAPRDRFGTVLFLGRFSENAKRRKRIVIYLQSPMRRFARGLELTVLQIFFSIFLGARCARAVD
jgi:hypothetical protein